MVEQKEVVKLTSLDEIPLGQGRCFKVDGREIAVFRPRGGGICAIENRCPHRQGPLSDGITGQDVVICPYHNHRFNLQTGEGSEGDETVQVFPVTVEGGEILLEL